MEKIKVMNKATARTIQLEVEEALQAVGERLGLAIKVQGGAFYPTEGRFTPKLEIVLTHTEDGKPVEQHIFESACNLLNLKPEHYKAQVKLGAKRFEIVGFNLGSPKYRILAREVGTGRDFKLTEDVLDQIRPAAVAR